MPGSDDSWSFFGYLSGHMATISRSVVRSCAGVIFPRLTSAHVAQRRMYVFCTYRLPSTRLVIVTSTSSIHSCTWRGFTRVAGACLLIPATCCHAP